MSERKDKSFYVRYMGQRYGRLFNCTGAKYAKQKFIELWDHAHEVEELMPSYIRVCELAHLVRVADGCSTLDEAGLAIEASKYAPDGLQDPIDDEKHDTCSYFVKWNNIHYRCIAHVTNWKPDYEFDKSGEHGSFKIDYIEVTRL